MEQHHGVSIMKQHHGVGVLFTTQDRERFLFQQKDAYYAPKPYGFSFFGGEVEFGEEPLEAAIREVTEELSAKIASHLQPETTSLIFSGVINAKHDYHFTLFECVVDQDFFREITETQVLEGRGSVVLDRATFMQLKMIWNLEQSVATYFEKWKVSND